MLLAMLTLGMATCTTLVSCKDDDLTDRKSTVSSCSPPSSGK